MGGSRSANMNEGGEGLAGAHQHQGAGCSFRRSFIGSSVSAARVIRVPLGALASGKSRCVPALCTRESRAAQPTSVSRRSAGREPAPSQRDSLCSLTSRGVVARIHGSQPLDGTCRLWYWRQHGRRVEVAHGEAVPGTRDLRPSLSQCTAHRVQEEAHPTMRMAWWAQEVHRLKGRYFPPMASTRHPIGADLTVGHT